MLKNPFEKPPLPGGTSTAFGSTPASGHCVQVHSPYASRVLVPGALAVSGVIVPIILYFALEPPLNLTMASVTAMMELATAVSLYFLFNSSFVRADEMGITKSQFGKSQSVRWNEIATMSKTQVGQGPTQLEFKDASGKRIFQCSTLGNLAEGQKLLDFIEKKLQQRRDF